MAANCRLLHRLPLLDFLDALERCAPRLLLPSDRLVRCLRRCQYTIAAKTITPTIQAMNMVLTTFVETQRPVTYMRHPAW